MNKSSFIIFFAIVLALYSLINFYFFLTGWYAIPVRFQNAYIAIFLFWSLSYLAGRFLERAWPTFISTIFIWVGSFWLAAMVYFLIASLLIDTSRLLNIVFHFYPAAGTKELTQLKYITFASVNAVVMLVVFLGFLNARSVRIRKLKLKINKNANGVSNLRIAMASDIHLGTIIGKKRIEHIVDKINQLDADIVLLPGDVVDEDIGPVIRRNLGEIIQKIRAEYGVYAITGNHEYIGGAQAACKYLEEHGVIELRDRYVKVADSFYIVGREDRASKSFAGILRKNIGDLMKGIDLSLPVFMMDHQPVKLDEAVNAGVDLQLSGHTHHGQLWPFNFITKKVYELSAGYKQKGSTHFYVSCGAGTWGPPVRTGNRPEIVNIEIEFLRANNNIILPNISSSNDPRHWKKGLN